MNKKYLISGLAVLTIVATAAGVATTVLAAGDSGRGNLFGNFGRHKGQEKQLTDEQKAAKQTQLTAVQAAINAGDYNAWVAAVKKINENSPLLDKITADNFARFAEAYKLSQQAKAIYDELGIQGHGMMFAGLGAGARGMGLGD